MVFCVAPIARNIALMLAAAAVIHCSLSVGRRRAIPWLAFAGYGLLIILSIWLGSYRLSPAGFSSGRIPLLSGFVVTQPQRAPEEIVSGQVVSMGSGAPLAIQPMLLPGPVACMWLSSNGGEFDGPDGCDTVYSPGDQIGFSVLLVSVRSGCGLPPALGEIKISILP